MLLSCAICGEEFIFSTTFPRGVLELKLVVVFEVVICGTLGFLLMGHLMVRQLKGMSKSTLTRRRVECQELTRVLTRLIKCML